MASGTGSASGPSRTRRPRLRTVLLAVNLLILALPLGGVAVLRLYENALVHDTEEQLLVQGAVVREMYRHAYARAAGATLPLPPPADPSGTAVVPRLDVSRDEVAPPAAAGGPAAVPPDPVALAAGAEMLPALESATRQTLAGIRVVDRAGTVVASSGGELGLSLAAREEVRRALAGEEVRLLRQRVSDEPAPALRSASRGQRYRVFVALPARGPEGAVVGAVVLSRTPVDIAKALYGHRITLAWMAVAVLAVVVLVSALAAWTVLRPAEALIRHADRVVRGERGAVLPIAEPGTHEMARLSEAIAAMARTLQDRADYIRTFASHVSHEFKTPLTAIRGTVELLRDHLDGMTPAERERFLTLLEESASRLEQLVRRMLQLARADALLPGPDRTPLLPAVERAAARAREAGLAVDVEAAPGAAGVEVRMAPENLDEVLANLLENARVHGGEGTSVRIEILPGAEIRVQDDGPGISDANAARVFTPFFTTARDRGGSGLGLSIVRSLLEAHGGSIALEPGRPGARFRLRLPAVTTS